MNPADRATLIDFALGRLEDAEAAALARRAEVDSEFAQTLDALRQELTTLDRVRLDAFRTQSRPSLCFADKQNTQNSQDKQNAETRQDADARENNAQTAFPLPLASASLKVDDESNGEARVAPLLSLPHVVKTRRVGPAYPFYADECATSPEETEPSQTFDGENDEAEPIKQNGKNTQVGEAESVEQAAQVGENTQAPRRFKRFDFIPKFIAAASPRQSSPFVAKRARLLDDASSPISSVAEAANADAFLETPPSNDFDAQENVGVFNLADATPPVETQKENAFKIQNVSPSDAEATLPTLQNDDEESVYRVDAQENVGVFNLADATPPVETQKENAFKIQNISPSDAEATPSTLQNDDEESVYRVDAQENVEDFNASNLAARRLVELLGREPTAAEREEYYWEEVDEAENAKCDAISPTSRRVSLWKTSARWASAPVVAVGRATLALCGTRSRAILGSDAFAATKQRRRRQPGKASDTMISTVAGILIATFVVFPLMRLAVREIFATIAKSAVRKIGENVAISENAPTSDLLPFISEQLVFPRYETADPQGVGVVETPLETGTRSETPLPPADDSPLPLDPASTPPTLESVPVDAPPADELAPPTL